MLTKRVRASHRISDTPVVITPSAFRWEHGCIQSQNWSVWVGSSRAARTRILHMENQSPEVDGTTTITAAWIDKQALLMLNRIQSSGIALTDRLRAKPYECRFSIYPDQDPIRNRFPGDSSRESGRLVRHSGQATTFSLGAGGLPPICQTSSSGPETWILRADKYWR